MRKEKAMCMSCVRKSHVRLSFAHTLAKLNCKANDLISTHTGYCARNSLPAHDPALSNVCPRADRTRGYPAHTPASRQLSGYCGFCLCHRQPGSCCRRSGCFFDGAQSVATVQVVRTAASGSTAGPPYCEDSSAQASICSRPGTAAHS